MLAGFAPEVIVLGGGISRAAHLFLPAAQSELADSGLRLLVSELQDSAPLVGCAVARFNHRTTQVAAANPVGTSAKPVTI
jgi:predicted NBD/HSP70 family sugar kinase